MTILIGSRKKKQVEPLHRNGVSKLEYDITKFILDYMSIDIDDDYSILKYGDIVKFKKRHIAFPHYYMSIRLLGRDQEMFRPLQHESHADFLIEMFTNSYNGHIDYFSYETNENGYYDGWFVANNKDLGKSKIFNIPSVSILKCASVARMIMDANDYSYLMSRIMHYISETNSETNG